MPAIRSATSASDSICSASPAAAALGSGCCWFRACLHCATFAVIASACAAGSSSGAGSGALTAVPGLCLGRWGSAAMGGALTGHTGIIHVVVLPIALW